MSKLEETEEAARWATNQMLKLRSSKKAAKVGMFPSVSITKTGAWIKDQYDRMANELDDAVRRERDDGSVMRRSGFGAHYDDTARRLRMKRRDDFLAWHKRMVHLLDHVQVLAESLADDDQVTLSVDEVKKLSTSMERSDD